MRPSWRHILEYWAVRLVVCVIQAIPLSACQTLADGCGWLVWRWTRLRKQLVLDNVSQAYPEWSPERCDRLGLAMWRHLFLLVFEVAHLPRKIRETTYQRYIRFRNADLVGRLLLSDQPFILVSAHYGNFELAGYVLALLGFQQTSVARPLDNPLLGKWLDRFRASKGQRLLPKTGSADEISELLGAGKTLGVLADQHAGAKGCRVEFFGREASTHKAIALFALTASAPLVVGGARRLGRPLHYELIVSAEADPQLGGPETAGVRELTQWYTGELETLIREAPDQYWWLHERWRDASPRKRRKRRAA